MCAGSPSKGRRGSTLPAQGAARRRGDAPQAAPVNRRDPPDASGASEYR
jgi:hypothetical protein